MDWIQRALHEYEQIASLCNAQSTLSNTAMSSSSTTSTGIHDNDNDLDPKKLSAQLQQRSLHEQLANYYKEIDAVRRTHSLLKKQLIAIQENDNETDQDTNNNIPTKQYRTSHKIEAFSNHIQLCERVIRTVMMQTSTECGILYANGLVRSTSADQHEINIVALAALRASVSQLKEKFGD